MDLGCGTGLVGPMFRDWAGRLVGVDLSPAMLRKARDRDLYDELYEDDMFHYLRTLEPLSFELVLASDALCYVGDLDPVFIGCYDALREGGLVAFTVEGMLANMTEGTFRLHPDTGRFSHSVTYVKRVAEAAGFTVRLHREARLGQHERYGRKGDVYVLQKVATAAAAGTAAAATAPP